MSMRQYKKFLWCLLAGICLTIYCLTLVNPLSKEEETINVDYNLGSGYQLEDGTYRDEASGETNDDVHMVVPSGEPIGIYVKTNGVMVINTGTVRCYDGTMKSPCFELILPGDYIVSVNGKKIEDKNTLISCIAECENESLNLGIIRNNTKLNVNVKPIINAENKYMLGLWVKDDISGIGTMTYYDENGFGALGHSINDTDTGKLFEISDGAIYKANLINIVKANDTSPGRLEGLIDYSSSNVLGRVSGNGEYGIKGYVTENGYKKMTTDEWMPVGNKEDVHLGAAYIISSVSGKRCYYDVEITEIDISSNSKGKEIELIIKDSDLLKLTSGIVQGMSGTPIIQDGKLVGAITHVFLKDSAKGYGIFIEEMMKQ